MNSFRTRTLLRMSELYMPTIKEDPADVDVTSAKLLYRAGMLRKEASGLYSFLPLGMRVLNKLEAIIREEMDSHGAQEILMPFVQSSDLWRESGRWGVYGEEMLRMADRHGNEFCLGPTHEEVVTDLVKNELRSYKDLPRNLYQIQLKFRDERRPRFGLLRSREFIMKDAYSFDADREGLDASYERMREAYENVCDRMGLEYRVVVADAGQIGGDGGTEEFMVLADNGEAELVYCDCGYAADVEAAACTPAPVPYVRAKEGMPAGDVREKVATPGVHTIDELAAFLGIPAAACMKAFSGKDGEGAVWVLFVPGDYEVNEDKASNLLGGFEPLTDDEMKDAGLVKGSMGPVGLPAGVKVAADASLKGIERWVVGANEDGFHFVGASQGDDFKVDAWGDLCTVREGDACPQCGSPLRSARGIEVGQIFKLGDKYSRAMGATFMDADGSEKPFIMGCYGIGVSRAMAAAVEQRNDEHGIIWPAAIAPAHVAVIPLSPKPDEVTAAAEELAGALADAGLEVVIDDRDERAGVKFNDNDLIGWPVQVVVGKRGLKEGVVEVKDRATGDKESVALDQVLSAVERVLS
ncbi:proline--tRNA ligase [Slackia exigua]|uniref:proline--tRNA ligase n=1 Tax=Slackia exigua TaxID=84109 RepID=UPI0023F12E37|nr:proline--tRNA ligase [Slackia exigua]